MDRLEFFERFGKAVSAFANRNRLKDELGAYAESARAGLPRNISIPYSEVAKEIMFAAQSPELVAVAAERAYRATLPWWMRRFIYTT